MLKNIENLKNYKNIKEAIDLGENVVVVTKWAYTNTAATRLADGFDCYFFETETEKAILFVNENKNKKIWLPKSQILFFNNKEKGLQITKVFIGI